MNPELRTFMHNSSLDQSSFKYVMANLPTDDAELDRDIEAAIANDQMIEVRFLVPAALEAGRPVDARHLLKGLVMFESLACVPDIALRMQGDVARYLVEAVEATFLTAEASALALCVAALWCAEHRNGEWPPALIREARQIARYPNISSATIGFLLAIVINTKDRGLLALVQKHLPPMSEDRWKNILEGAIPLVRFVFAIAMGSFLDKLDEINMRLGSTGMTVRRAVAKTGRNEPCPCNSGKKYKNCCYAKDQERLHHSSDVPGVTIEEFEATPELYLTAARLKAMPVHILVRLHPTEIPRPLLDLYLDELTKSKCYDRAVEVFEQISFDDDIAAVWAALFFALAMGRRKANLERLLRARELQRPMHIAEFKLVADLLREENNPARCIELIENQALAALRAEDAGDTEKLSMLGVVMACSSFPALKILIERAILPVVRASTPWFTMLSWNLFETRDTLNLAPDDASTAIIDALNRNSASEAQAQAAIAKARREAEARRTQFRQVQETLKQVQRKAKHAIEPSPPQTAAAQPNPMDTELRRKIDLLMEDVKREHAEKNMYRKKYEETQKAAEEWRAQAEAAQQAQIEPAPDPEDALLLPEEGERNEPVRIIEFPRNFQQHLTSLPRHVAKAAVSGLGGIAAGETESFAGIRRIERSPDVLRQRFGEYRLLFRLLPDRVQVIDLVPRQDFERSIKTLAARA